MLSSRGEKIVLASKSHKIQKIEPSIKEAGIITIGLEVKKNLFAKNGTAMPTKEIGPANAVTVAESRLESRIRIGRKILVLTPIVLA